MTKEQRAHYLAGGLFSAIYNPKILNISIDNVNRIGEKVTAYANILITPVICPHQYEGQHRFNSSAIDGWSPEEDLDDLQIIPNEYSEEAQCILPQHFYKLTYLSKEAISRNFGNGSWSAPLVIERTYVSKCDEYVVRHLGEVEADKVEYFLWNGEPYDEIQWATIDDI